MLESQGSNECAAQALRIRFLAKGEDFSLAYCVMDQSTLPKVVAEVFGVPIEGVTDDLSPDTLDDWDSLSHLRLVTALEEAFAIKFENSEIMDLTSVGAIREMIGRKTAATP